MPEIKPYTDRYPAFEYSAAEDLSAVADAYYEISGHSPTSYVLTRDGSGRLLINGSVYANPGDYIIKVGGDHTNAVSSTEFAEQYSEVFGADFTADIQLNVSGTAEINR